MTQEAQLTWRQTAGKIPVPPCPTIVQGFEEEASSWSPSQGYALVSRAQESPKRALSHTMALAALFAKLPCSSSATSEWDVQKQDPHSAARVPPWDPHRLLTGMGATSKKPEGNLCTPPFPQGKQWCKGLSRAGAGTGLLCTQISSPPCQGAEKRMAFFPPLIAKTLKSSAGQRGGRETNEDKE